MSECFKRSNALPEIVQQVENDSKYVRELKELIINMTSFHDKERVQIGIVKERLRQLQCK